MSNVLEADAPPAKVLSSVVPYLCLDGAAAAAAFYERAFGAVIVAAMPADANGKTHNIHLHVHGISVMLSDWFPELTGPFEAPQGFNLMLMVDDAHAWCDRAAVAGAEVISPIQQMFWGDTYGQVRDPFGVTWAINQPAG